MKNTNKFSSGYIPPEMARLLWRHKKGERVQVRKDVKELNGQNTPKSVYDSSFAIEEVWD
jgi:hypothetical protein